MISQTIPQGGAGHSWYPGLSSDTSSDEADATTESDVEAGDGADNEQKKSKSKSRERAKLNWIRLHSISK